MVLINHEPLIKAYGNGFQITFNSKYTVIIKNGIGAKCTQTKAPEDTTAMLLASRLGGNSGPDVECEIYDANNNNISLKFGEASSLGYVTPIQLVNLLYTVSNLR